VKKIKKDDRPSLNEKEGTQKKTKNDTKGRYNRKGDHELDDAARNMKKEKKRKRKKLLRLKWSNFQTKKKPDPTPVTLNIKHGEIKEKRRKKH
jgi:hypothetical protein